MSVSSISNASRTQTLISQLTSQSATLGDLSTQLATGHKHTNLTEYQAADASNLLNLKSAATQLDAFSTVNKTVQSRLSAYDTTLSDIESIVSQAQTLVNGSQNYSASTAGSLAATASSYLKSVTVDLNQQINGRYIYAGSRYQTAPVTDLTTLSGAPSTTILTDSASLPTYDSAYTAPTLTTSTTASTITIGGTATTPQKVSAVVNGTTYSYTVQITDTTPNAVATGLAAVINASVPGTTATGGVITVGSTGTGLVTAASANTTSTTAYAVEAATIASGYNLTYGVTSDDPAFQQVIAGLRFLQAAGNSTDAATYKSNLAQASALLTSGLSAVQAVNTTVANNINILTTEAKTQSSQLNDLTTQVDDIQGVDTAQVSAEISALQTILEASYTVTGDLEKLSIASYL